MNNQIKERSRMYKVYWTENVTQSAQSKSFESTEMMPALAYVEVLRKQQDEDGNKLNSFVTFISENPNCVGKPGAADVDADYNWTKRRSTALRKDQAAE
jgi:hypothetical protein